MRKRMTVLIRTAVVITGIAVLAGTGLVSADAGVNPRPEPAVAQGATAGLSYRLPDGFQSKYAQVNDFRMHYLRGGNGSPVVLLHGFPQTSAEWEPQLKALAQNHTVIAVDLRGTGDSSVPQKGYDTAQLADDVHELLTQLNLEKGVQIVAHDIGAWIAYPYAAMWPNEVSRMVVMEGPIPDRSLYRFPAFPAEGELSTWHLGFFQKDFAQDLVRGHERDLVKGFIEQYLAVDGAFDDRDYEFYAQYLREPGRFKAWMDMYQALHTDIVQNEKFREAGLLQLPVLAVGGEEALSSAVGAQWQGYAANVETQVMADTGHWLTEERPQELTSMLLKFLR
ncbi:alpha/beta hydrolase [Lentzea sp. BCCO 10_0061]|uniref:Alpha/beta hydrolase n=1 Tax=Lentzea sokolovensis TaxID=3095429 RepID=A0ABU4UQ71_9PSEU|nr:alpha/beta hydrolase [Lentzea sp. BCCO 10_0061]MDX8141637.1 alpha/beta hydrolase [Lentzea sp. BCCO 10_0061]